MGNEALPKRLAKEPIIDTIFEIRFSASEAASTVLPGYFYATLSPQQWQIEKLLLSDIPSDIRNKDPNLRYQPLLRVHWDDFILLIGDAVLGIGCKMPYPGWNNFKTRIITVVERLKGTKIVQNIGRYSLKYVDLIEGKDLHEQIQRADIDVRVGSHTVIKEPLSVRVEIPHDPFVNVIQIVATASAMMPDNSVREGVLIDIDTICKYSTRNLSIFADELPDRLESIHIENKKMFFDCLKQETIDYLEPEYE